MNTIFTRYLLLPLLTSMVLVGCKPDDPDEPVVPPTTQPPSGASGVLSVSILPEWEGEPLEYFTEYRNFMDYRTTVELLKMYFGDVRMIGEPGDTSMVKDVDLFDLGSGPVTKYWPVSVGEWAKLRAGLGVPAELNYADPANYGPGHPLSVSNGTFWTWASGYRYVMFEGRYDPDPESTADLVSAYSIHPGMDPSYIEFELGTGLPITITEGDTTSMIVHLAVDQFFHSADHQIDLATENSAHGSNLPLQWKLVNNVVLSMTVE